MFLTWCYKFLLVSTFKMAWTSDTLWFVSQTAVKCSSSSLFIAISTLYLRTFFTKSSFVSHFPNEIKNMTEEYSSTCVVSTWVKYVSLINLSFVPRCIDMICYFCRRRLSVEDWDIFSMLNYFFYVFSRLFLKMENSFWHSIAFSLAFD